jgi:endonuclease/exonuclease/phosphatase family metal-dependent hydrolase
VRALRVVSLNTWKGDGPYRARLAAMAEQLRALEPDVVCLQEAFIAIDGSLSTPKALAAALSMNHATYAMREKDRMVEGVVVPSRSGLSTLSRWPIVEVVSRPIPSDPRDGDRGALLVAVETPLGVARIVNTHLTYIREVDTDTLKLEQVQAVLAEPWLRDAASIRLLCGDFNSVPDSPTVAYIREHSGWHVQEAAPRPRLGGERPVTFSPRNTNVREGARSAVLDYVFSLAPAARRQPRVSAAVVLDQPTGSVFPSDHFGVFAEIGAPPAEEALAHAR